MAGTAQSSEELSRSCIASGTEGADKGVDEDVDDSGGLAEEGDAISDLLT